MTPECRHCKIELERLGGNDWRCSKDVGGCGRGIYWAPPEEEAKKPKKPKKRVTR